MLNENEYVVDNLKKAGLTYEEAKIYLFLNENPKKNEEELASALGFDHHKLKDVLASLKAKGLIQVVDHRQRIAGRCQIVPGHIRWDQAVMPREHIRRQQPAIFQTLGKQIARGSNTLTRRFSTRPCPTLPVRAIALLAHFVSCSLNTFFLLQK